MGYTGNQDQAVSLSASMLATDYSFTTTGSMQLSRGLVEIDDELIWVDTFDKTSNTAVIAPYGRGFRGTTAATHASGTRVVLAPTFPRSSIERNINAAIDGIYPDLFGTASTTFTFNPVVTTYSLPSDAIDIIAISWQTIGPSQEWLPVRHYRLDRSADPTTWTSGKTISLDEPIAPGRTVTVRYTNKPPVLVNLTDVFETVTGLPSSAREVIVLGAAYRMAVYLDLARVPASGAEASGLSASNPVGTAVNISRALQNIYKDRLQTEVRRQQEQFPPRVHISR
jgi:hypothetical protein